MTQGLTTNQVRVLKAMQVQETEYGQAIYYAHESGLGTKAATPVLLSLIRRGMVKRSPVGNLTDCRAYVLTDAGRFA